MVGHRLRHLSDVVEKAVASYCRDLSSNSGSSSSGLLPKHNRWDYPPKAWSRHVHTAVTRDAFSDDEMYAKQNQTDPCMLHIIFRKNTQIRLCSAPRGHTFKFKWQSPLVLTGAKEEVRWPYRWTASREEVRVDCQQTAQSPGYNVSSNMSASEVETCSKRVLSHSYYMTISLHVFMWRGRRCRYNSQQSCQTTNHHSSHTTGYFQGCLWIFQSIFVAKK